MQVFHRARVVACALGLGFTASSAYAAAPVCYSSYNGYCQYTGKVAEAYMNAYDEVILYFDTALDPGLPGSVGLSGVTITNAAKYNMAANKDFGKSLFAAMLAAQARGANVIVQMHSVSGGYLVMDRIWVQE